MTVTIPATPGQKILLPVQVIDGYGSLHDGYQAPTLDFILTPQGLLEGFPAPMTEVIAGIWKIVVTLPSGSTAVGQYLGSASWPHPDTGVFQNELFLINVSLPFGNISIIPR